MKIDKEAFKKLYELKGLTTYNISDALDVSQSTVSAWMTRESIPTKYIKRVSDLLEVSLDEFERLVIEDQVTPINEEDEGMLVTILNDKFKDYFTSDEKIDLDPSNAGSLKYHAGFIALKNNVNGAELFLQINSNDLEPTIKFGDYVGIKEVTKFIEYGRPFMIIIEGNEVMFRRIIRSNNNKSLVLRSDNNNLDDIVVPTSSVIRTFLIVSVISMNIS